MEGEIFLDEYDGQSVEELIGLQKTHRIDSIVLAFESALDTRKEGGDKMSDVELVILAIEGFEREINNGGFSQFFYNSTAEYAPIIVASLKAIGCEQMADLARRAVDSLEIDSLDPESIEERMDPDDDELESLLNELDEQYFDCEEVPDYALFDYIKKNRAGIRLAGQEF